jgi:hypothetical protein
MVNYYSNSSLGLCLLLILCCQPETDNTERCEIHSTLVPIYVVAAAVKVVCTYGDVWGSVHILIHSLSFETQVYFNFLILL